MSMFYISTFYNKRKRNQTAPTSGGKTFVSTTLQKFTNFPCLANIYN